MVSFVKIIGVCALFLLSAGTALVALLHQNAAVRKAFFASMMATMAENLTNGPERCAMLTPITRGSERNVRVLEIGFGSGANLPCLAQAPADRIADYVAVEPNEAFGRHIDATVQRVTRAAGVKALPFKLSIEKGVAERLPFNDQLFDFVLSTHVLCSVFDVEEALKEIYRVLKPGGKFVFMEHVAADANDSRRQIQEFVLPVWRVIGDGCEFRDIKRAMEATMSDKMDLQLETFDADFVPRPLAFVRPHLRGVATKQ